jgi:hypothetical protein
MVQKRNSRRRHRISRKYRRSRSRVRKSRSRVRKSRNRVRKSRSRRRSRRRGSRNKRTYSRRSLTNKKGGGSRKDRMGTEIMFHESEDKPRSVAGGEAMGFGNVRVVLDEQEVYLKRDVDYLSKRVFPCPGDLCPPSGPRRWMKPGAALREQQQNLGMLLDSEVDKWIEFYNDIKYGYLAEDGTNVYLEEWKVLKYFNNVMDERAAEIARVEEEQRLTSLAGETARNWPGVRGRPMPPHPKSKKTISKQKTKPSPKVYNTLGKGLRG